MPTTIQEIYDQILRTLPPGDYPFGELRSIRLRLATLILTDLVQQNTDTVDQSDTWTEED